MNPKELTQDIYDISNKKKTFSLHGLNKFIIVWHIPAKLCNKLSGFMSTIVYINPNNIYRKLSQIW